VSMVDNPIMRKLMGWMLGSVRKGIPVERHSNYIYYLDSHEPFRLNLLLPNLMLGYVYLLDRNGRIRWRCEIQNIYGLILCLICVIPCHCHHCLHSRSMFFSGASESRLLNVWHQCCTVHACYWLKKPLKLRLLSKSCKSVDGHRLVC
jgi:hypothetical protein